MNPKRYHKPPLTLIVLALGAAIGLPTASLVAAKLVREPADHPAAAPALAVSTLAMARIASVDLDIAKSELKAPFDGILTHRLADEGGVLSAGATVLELSHWMDEPGLWLPLSALAAGTRGLWQAYATEPLTSSVPGAPEAE